MQTDEITSLKAKIARLEEVNALLVKALNRASQYVRGFDKLASELTGLPESDLGFLPQANNVIGRAMGAAKSLREFNYQLDCAREGKID